MKIVMPGGMGHVGRLLAPALRADGHQVVVLSRRNEPGTVAWDGRSLGPWAAEIDGADAVINLAGRSVNCRSTPANRKEMMASRVESTRVVGEAIARAARPPEVWLQMSTATVYAHSLDRAHDEFTGTFGGPGTAGPRSWDFSVSIGQRWEEAQAQAPTPRTRKVALRSAIVLMPGPGSIFDILLGLTRWGLGGTIAGGRQVISWIHGEDFIRAIRFLLERRDIEGPVIVAAPEPLPQKEFMAHLRRAWGMPIGLPATAWMMDVVAFLIRTESELTLKSRNVLPARMLKAGFQFTWPEWKKSAEDLVRRAKTATPG